LRSPVMLYGAAVRVTAAQPHPPPGMLGCSDFASSALHIVFRNPGHSWQGDRETTYWRSLRFHMSISRPGSYGMGPVHMTRNQLISRWWEQHQFEPSPRVFVRSVARKSALKAVQVAGRCGGKPCPATAVHRGSARARIENGGKKGGT
jgi:hypothetical protein